MTIDHAIPTLVSNLVIDQGFSTLVKMIGGLDLQNGPWVAGGCARRLWSGEPWSIRSLNIQNYHDVDIFFPNEMTFDTVSRIFDKHHHETTELISVSGYSGSVRTKPFSTCNAHNYLVQVGHAFPNLAKVQCIKTRWFDSVESIIDSFDLTISQFVTDGKMVLAHPDAISDCRSRTLRRASNKLGSIDPKRVIKYGLYGFNPVPEIMHDMVRAYLDENLELNANTSGFDDY